MTELDRKAIESRWNGESKQERMMLNSELWKIIRHEEQAWRQKSRVKWLLEGDRNTRFFHCVMNGRWRSNSFIIFLFTFFPCFLILIKNDKMRLARWYASHIYTAILRVQPSPPI